MNPPLWSLVAGGAAVGAVARFRLGQLISYYARSDFPWGTWCVNVLGTALLGIFYQLFDRFHTYNDWWALLGTGFCGAFTTFSTMSVESIALFRKLPLLCILYLGSSFIAGVLLAYATGWI